MTAHSERPGHCAACSEEVNALQTTVDELLVRVDAQERRLARLEQTPAGLCRGCGKPHAECDGSKLGCWRPKPKARPVCVNCGLPVSETAMRCPVVKP